MATLTDATKEGVVYHLGYTSKPNSTEFLADLNRTDFTDRDVTGIDATVARLDAIDTELGQSQSIWMTRQAGTKMLDYAQKQRLLKSEGSRLLFELAHKLNIAVALDKYQATNALSRMYY